MHPFTGNVLAHDRQTRLRAEAERHRLLRRARGRRATRKAWRQALAGLATRLRTRRPTVVTPSRALGTVLFSDIVASAATACTVGDAAWRRLLEEHNHRVDTAVAHVGGRRVKHTGDGVMCVFDLPGQALRCAAKMHVALNDLSLPVRIGVHTGEIELLGDDIAGLTVYIAARVMNCAGAGETWTSSTVRDLVVGARCDLVDQGVRALRGVGDWRVYRVNGVKTAPVGRELSLR